MNLVLKILLLTGLLVVCGILLWRVFFIPQSYIKVCPVDAIRMDRGKAVIETAKCIGCRRCVDGIGAPPPKSPNVAPKAIPMPPRETTAPQEIVTTPKIETTKPASEPKPKVEKMLGTYKVDPDKCIGCQLCITACPVNAISLVNEKAVIDKHKCINCGICEKGNQVDFNGCPVQAISSR
jgi:ferredoxin